MRLLKKDRLPTLVAVIVPMIVYLLTAPHGITGFGDSDELVTSGHFLGLPHPPGYPLFTILVFIFTHLPIPTSLFYKANLISIFSASISIGIFYLLCVRLLTIVSNKIKNIYLQKSNIQIYISISLALMLAFTQLFWTYALISEVFALNMLLVLAIIYLAIQQYQSLNPAQFYLICLFIGLGLAHQQIIIILIPFLIFLLWNQLKNNIALVFRGIIISFVIPLLLYIFLFRFADPNAPQSWQVEPTLKGYTSYILRQDYKAIHENNAYITDVVTPQNFHALISYFQEMLQQLTPFIIILTLIGLTISWKLLPKRLNIFFVGLFLVIGPGIGFYLSLPQPPANPSEIAMGYAITQRMYLMGLPFYFLLAIIPILYIYEKRWIGKRIIIAALFFFPIVLFLANVPVTNLRNYKTVAEYSRNILTNLPDRAVLICFSDISCFSLISTQAIEKLRNDITIIPITAQMQNFATKKLPDIFNIYYSHNPNRIAGIVSWGLYLNQRIFVTEINPYYIENLGLDGKALFLSPFDLTFEITKTPQTNTINYAFVYSNTDQQKYLPFQKAFDAVLFEQFARNGTLYARLGQKIQANEYYTQALMLKPRDPTITQLVKELPKYNGNQAYQLQNESMTSDQIIANAPQCNGNQKCLAYIYQLASIIDPINIPIRNVLVEIYQNIGVQDLVLEESANIQALSAQK